MSGSTSTATVETLTAEVRVLVVGNRQITLSVAKQLDFVSLDELKVFGRVKLGGNAPDDLVIGSDLRGNLALARYQQFRLLPSWAAWLEIDERWPESELPQVGWSVRTNSDGEYELSFSSGLRINCYRENCTVHPGEKAYYEAYSEWRDMQNAFCRQHRNTDGFDIPEPHRSDFGAYGWSPGPHAEEIETNACEQLAEAQRRHKLYEDAKSAPLIVLAGLK